jgi:hypothetical protein
VRATDELLLERHDSFIVKQRVAARRDDDRIHDKIWNFEGLRRRGDGFHDGGVGEHAGFGGVRAKICHDGFELCRHQIGLHRFDARDARRVLRGNSRNGADAVDAVCSERFQVGLNTGARA